MEIVRKSLIDEIEKSKTLLDESRLPTIIKGTFRNLENEVTKNTSIQDNDNAERGEEVISNFKKAWEYGMGNYTGEPNILFLTEVAGRVEPSLRMPGQTYAEISTIRRQFLNGYSAPIDKERIMKHLERMDRAKDAEIHPVEEAVYNYFHITRIQPFSNGNKRTASIVMNSILKSAGFLPISISQKDTEEFMSYLMSGINGFVESSSRVKKGEELHPYYHPDIYQRQFYDFLARQELSTLRSAENKLRGMQTYTIDIESDNPGPDYRLKNELKKYFKSRDSLNQVRINERKKRIDVIGEIPLGTLEKIISRVNGIKRTKITNMDFSDMGCNCKKI